jgi:hypothetical protein
MLQTSKLFAIYGMGVVERTPGCDVDFVQGTAPFRFGVWLYSLRPDDCYAYIETSSWIDAVQTLEVIVRVPPLRLEFSMQNH